MWLEVRMDQDDVSRGGYSLSRVLVAHALLGTPGLVAGANRRRQEPWARRDCGFGQTYRLR